MFCCLITSIFIFFKDLLKDLILPFQAISSKLISFLSAFRQFFLTHVNYQNNILQDLVNWLALDVIGADNQGRRSSFRMGEGLILNVIRSHLRSSIPSESGSNLWGENRIALRRAQEVKQGVSPEANCKTAVAIGVEVKISCQAMLAPSTGESLEPYEILNEDKMKVGERLFLRRSQERNRSSGTCPRKIS